MNEVWARKHCDSAVTWASFARLLSHSPASALRAFQGISPAVAIEQNNPTRTSPDPRWARPPRKMLAHIGMEFRVGSARASPLSTPSGLEVFQIGAGFLLGRHCDSMDVERVQLYELVKP